MPSYGLQAFSAAKMSSVLRCGCARLCRMERCERSALEGSARVGCAAAAIGKGLQKGRFRASVRSTRLVTLAGRAVV